MSSLGGGGGGRKPPPVPKKAADAAPPAAKQTAGKRRRRAEEPSPPAAAAAAAANPDYASSFAARSGAVVSPRAVAIAAAAEAAAAAQPPQPARKVKTKKTKSSRRENRYEAVKNIFGLWDSADELSCDEEDEDDDEEDGIEVFTSEDRRPKAGRFSSANDDDYDRQCIPQKLKHLRPAEIKRLKSDALRRVRQRNLGLPTAAAAAAAASKAAAAVDVSIQEERMEDVPDEAAQLDEEMALQALIDTLADLALADEKQAEERMRINTREHLSCDLLRDQRMCKGDLILDAIRKALNSMGYTRSTFQMMFHDNFIQACLPIIYGNEWPFVSERVLNEFGITRLRPEVLVQTPRRFGKTMSIAMFVTAMLLCVADIRVCVFSTGKRASGSLMAEIVALLTKAGHQDRIIKQNQEQLFISQTARAANVKAGSEAAKSTYGNAGVSKLFSFPAGTAGQSLAHT